MAGRRDAVVVYGSALMPYTEKVVRGLRLKRVEHTLVEPSSPEDYRRWSPDTGLLPVLEIGGTRVPDSGAILDLLDERFPEPPLLAADPQVAREQRRLEEWVGETFSFYLFRWLRARLGSRAEVEERQDPAAPRGPMARLGLLDAEGRPKAAFFDTSEGGPGPEFERKLADLSRLLGGRPFFYGERVSRADLAVFAFLWGMASDRYPGGRALLAAHPGLLGHTGRVDDATRG